MSRDEDHWIGRRIRLPPFWDDFFEEDFLEEESSNWFPDRMDHRHSFPWRTLEPVGIPEEQEPLVDLLEYKKEVRVIAWLPGFNKQDIRLHATAHTLTISTEAEELELAFPAIVDPERMKVSYRNGVLKVKLKRMKRRARGLRTSVKQLGVTCSADRGEFRRSRKTYRAVCADCGNECEVPFKPDPDRPSYCPRCRTERRADKAKKHSEHLKEKQKEEGKAELQTVKRKKK